MKCLHICNDLLGSKVHENLYSHLEALGLEQVIYYNIRPNSIGKAAQYEDKTALNVVGSKPLKKYHRILFRNKINHLYKDLDEKLDLKTFDLVHATTIYGDGAVALKIYENYGIPYILAVRSTDVNLFLRFRKDLNPLMKSILINAKKIIFISESMANNFFKNPSIKKLEENLKSKCETIYNGLDKFWLQNIATKKSLRPHKLLFIGKFNRNKNALNLIYAVLKSHQEDQPITLDLIGEGGRQERKIILLAEKHKDIIKYHGPVYDKNELRKIFNSSDIFAMTSIAETFGLVYVEALSQGLPILFTKNQGIDGTFEVNIGEAVEPKSIDSIADGINRIIANYNSYELNKIDFTIFKWENIANKYLKLYQSVNY
jgi:glycosyltransferase involved in cell wall biosynthesis